MLILTLVRPYTLLIKCDTLELKFPILHSHFVGEQQIQHPDSYVIPLSIRNGLPYIDMHPHVFFTSDETWNPTIMDQEYHTKDIITTEDDHISC
jgi:hypothetical protein